FIGELRDVNTQKDSLRFRYNLIRIGEVMAYEISKTLHYKEEKIQTPLGIAVTPQISDQIVLGIILRAGLPLHQGLHNYFDKAENAIISAYRKHSLVDDNDFHIEIEYLSAPSIEGKVLILCDPMLASGMSMVLAHKVLTQHRGT